MNYIIFKPQKKQKISICYKTFKSWQIEVLHLFAFVILVSIISFVAFAV
jgi:hypothetical protein